MSSSRVLAFLTALVIVYPVAGVTQSNSDPQFGNTQYAAQSVPDAQFWLTTEDRSSLLALQPAPLHFTTAADQSPAVVVNDMQQFQPIEGFGVAMTGGSCELLMRMTPERRKALLEELFSPQGDGIHISYIRLSIGSSDMNEPQVYSYDDMPAGQTDPNMDKFSLDPDRAYVIPLLKEVMAIDPQLPILGSPWSAPAWMKTNDDVKGGHLKPEFYSAYAKYFVKYIQGMQAEGDPDSRYHRAERTAQSKQHAEHGRVSK